ncbi:interferon-induced very large GTPase 1-like [Engystomops pustulosus]|uniref:interferon-induced very large GTPase 1-like n=1 Tax=Engystomops pustulosus TaxID=76066 RepID=UPI003AFA863B
MAEKKNEQATANADEQKNEQALKITDKTKIFRSEVKEQHDKMVEKSKEEAHKALELQSDKSFIDLIEKQIQGIDELFKKNDNITDEEVLKHASGVLALEGIFQTQDFDDLFKKREPLLCIPKGFQLLGPEQNPVFQQKEFTSRIEESSFQKIVEKMGLSLSNSMTYSFWGSGLKGSTGYIKYSDFEKNRKQSSLQTYVCTTRYNYIPLASCYFTKDQLRLSQAALNELQDIEKLISIQSDDNIVRMKATDFFQRFGSHANLGPIHFGGIYWWKASMEGITSEQEQEAKRITSEALNLYVGASYAGNGGDFDLSKTNTQCSIERSTISEFQKDIQFFSTKTGGPSAVDSICQWKAGLETSNKTWSVIDRGFQLMPVWEIIVSNHRDQFTDVIKLSSYLMDSYTFSTGLTSKTIVGDNLLAIMEKTKLFLEDVKSWKAEDAEEHLQRLIDFKQSLCETTNSYTAWVNICLSDKGLQEFLVSVVKKYQQNTEKDLYMIRISLQELLETHVYSVDHFPDASFIMRWIYNSEKNECDQISVSDFEELLDVLKKSKENVSRITVSSSREEHYQAKIKATLNISASLYLFLKTMKKVKQKEIELLVLLIASNSGFCMKNLCFCNSLGWREIEFLQNSIEEAYKEYTNLKIQSDDQAQAFVLYTGLTCTDEYKEMSAQQKADRMNYMKTQLEGCIVPDVEKILHQQSECCDWSKMEDNLRAFAYGSKVEKVFSTDEFTKELKSICKNKISFTSPDEQTESSNTDNDFLLLLERLDLVKYYPQKMKKADFHKIFRASMSDTQSVGEKELSFHYLQKLLTLDYRARYIQCKSDDDLCQKNTVTKNEGKKYSVKDFLTFGNKKTEKQDASYEQPIHPMDVQMAILHCANDFMRQYIYTKLSICQFALPLLIPNPSTKCIEFPLWSFQEVKKKWKTKRKAHEVDQSNNKFVTEAQTSVVSFIRFGLTTVSKSQIINSLMSKQRHDIFYHRHCKGSTKKSVLMNGAAEIAWYCPGGKDDDAFDDCTAFINLHGDARELDNQVQFLLKISSVIVAVFSEPDAQEEECEKLLQQLLDSPIPLICLLADKKFIPLEPALKVILGLKDMNEADLVNVITTAIQSLLDDSISQRFSLDKFASIARSQGFIVDLDKDLCKRGRDESQKLLSLLREKPVLTMKENFLPLQGDLWHRWCKKDKELTRSKTRSNVSIEQQRSDILSQKQALRNRQLEKAFPLNDFIRSFLQILHSNDHGSKLYFLQWFKMFLDNLSSETLSNLYQRYHHIWSNLNMENQKGKNKGILQKIKDNLEQILTRISFSTFGLEHILRELGQIYEALETFPEKDKGFCSLSNIAAQLLVSGYPVELMDGDAAHVSLKWIGAVLDELKGILGEKNLYIISVLGIQSTGKSTLLNAMFGLQFAVSAGRCTRGAFMQLIKVDEELEHELNFQYVLVIDTEGLRAIELSNKDSVNRDNELATFVIGLGNITIINIFGENPCEMQDILQIAVQAFLRMKQVNLKPSCLFVHQNVGEITAKEKDMEAGRRRLQEKLDEMTLCAAEQEHCDVTCFNDVIQFDVNTHIHYFAHLWEGDPPMAPPNPSYSENVKELRKIILNSGKQEKEANILSISMFKARVNDLWTALLNENFVFSFKNSLEIAAYNTLETKYSHWAWSLREHMLILQNKIINQIHNDTIKYVNVASLAKDFEEKSKNIQDDLNAFIEEQNSELLIQWRASTEIRLSALKSDLIAEVKKNADELFELKKNNKNIDNLKDTYEDEMFKRSKNLALTLKGKNLNDEELEEQFNDMWNDLLSKVTATIQLPQPPEIHQDLEKVFLERFKAEINLIETIRDSYNWDDLLTVFLKYIQSKKKWWNIPENLIKHDDQNNIEHTTSALQKRVNEYINQKEEQNMDYQPVYFYEILNMLKTEIQTKLDNFKFIREYELYVSLFLCHKAAKRFTQISEAFRKANNPLVYLESKKNEFCQSFKISCNKTKDTASLAELLCNTLKDSIQQEVTKSAAIQLASDIKCNDPLLNGNRSKLELGLLKSLAEKECFGDYITYIEDPKSAVQGFIRERIDKYCREKVKVSDIMKIRVDFFRNLISKVIDRSTAEVTDKCGDVKLWIEIFCQGLENDMQLSSKHLKSVEYQDITDMGFLKEAMTKALLKVVKNLKDEISERDLEILQNMTSKMLFDQFPGCWKQCPFCNAVCTHTTDTHDGLHSMQFHRPNGLRGCKWHKTSEFSIEICTTLIVSDLLCTKGDDGTRFPYKKYKDAGPPYNEWSITPDNSDLSYWKWVTCRFQSDFEKYYGFRFTGRGTIPAQWRNITKQEAIQEIEKLL